MKQLWIRMSAFLLLALAMLVLNGTAVFAAEVKDYVTTTRVNFRSSATTDAAIIATLNTGSAVAVTDYQAGGWSAVSYNGANGFIKSEFIIAAEAYQGVAQGEVELLNWTEVKNIFTIGVDASVYDVRTGITYTVRSFSNGMHADVEPATQADTALLLQTYNGRWAWDPRPVFVTINGRTIAGSINGMPHGGGVNSTNGMDGQICIHFRGSTVHNGNTSFARDHQDAITEAWNNR